MIAMSWPRAGTFSLLPTAMVVAARVSCCMWSVTVWPFASTAVRLGGTGPVTPRLPVAWPSHMQLPEPAAAGLIRVATPRTAAPGPSKTVAAAPATNTFMATRCSPHRVVELGEAEDVTAFEGWLAGDEDREGDRVRRLGHLAVPDAAAMTGPGDCHRRRTGAEVAVCLLDGGGPGVRDEGVLDVDRLHHLQRAEVEPLLDG